MKKGQMGQIGAIVMLAMALIVGAIFLQASAQQVGTVTNTVSSSELFLAPANGTAYYFNNYRAFGGTVAATNGSAITSDQYTVTNNVINPTTGALAVKLVPAANATFAQKYWTITSTQAQLTTYIDDSGGRGIANLIVLLMAVALVVVAAVFAIKSYME